jgi:hypothetical protein
MILTLLAAPTVQAATISAGQTTYKVGIGDSLVIDVNVAGITFNEVGGSLRAYFENRETLEVGIPTITNVTMHESGMVFQNGNFDSGLLRYDPVNDEYAPTGLLLDTGGRTRGWDSSGFAQMDGLFGRIYVNTSTAGSYRLFLDDSRFHFDRSLDDAGIAFTNANQFTDVNVGISSVPEPAMVVQLLSLGGVGGLALVRRLRRRKKALGE